MSQNLSLADIAIIAKKLRSAGRKLSKIANEKSVSELRSQQRKIAKERYEAWLKKPIPKIKITKNPKSSNYWKVVFSGKSVFFCGTTASEIQSEAARKITEFYGLQGKDIKDLDFIIVIPCNYSEFH